MRLSRTTWATLAVFTALVLFYLMVLSAAQVYYVPASPPLSTFSTSPEGLAGLYRYLTAAGVRAEQLQQYETLPDPSRAVMVTAGPLLRRPTAARVEQLKTWVERGGVLVLVAEEPNRFHDLARIQPSGGRQPFQEDVADVQATRVTAGVGRVRLQAGKSLAPLPDEAVIHVGAADRPRVASVALGRGTVVLVADEWALSNAGLDEADNLQFALGLVTAPGRDRVAFDEYHHGYAAGGGALTRMPVGARLSLVQLSLAAMALALAMRRRLGTPQAVEEEARRSPVEYVQSLGGLLRRAKAAPRAAAVLAKGLERDLAARLGRAVRDERAATRLLTDRGWDSAAEALSQAKEPVSDDRALVEYARIVTEGRREVAGAHRGRGRAR